MRVYCVAAALLPDVPETAQASAAMSTVMSASAPVVPPSMSRVNVKSVPDPAKEVTAPLFRVMSPEANSAAPVPAFAWVRVTVQAASVLSCALAPTAESRALAEAHGLRAQLDALDAEREGWFVADVTREELMAMRAEEELSSISGGGSGSSGVRGGMAQKSSGEASTKASGQLLGQLPPALEALYVTATGRAAGGDPVRLFTRLSCWFVPCPEAHLLLLDWVWGGGRPSDVLGALVDCCASGDLESARKLAFAQMIVSAQASGPVGGGTTAPVLVQKRNVVAMDGVAKAFDAGVRDVGLLYGGLHVDGLVRIARERFDYDVVDIEWRDAWRVNPPANESPLRYAIVPALLCVDGTDWAQTLHDVVALGGAASLLSLFLYIIRHGGLYYALGKWLLEWNRQLFETADDGLTAPTSVN